MNDNLDVLRKKIEVARKRMVQIQKGRAMLAGALGGLSGIIQSVVEFPDPDIAHVYQCMPSGRKIGDPVIYRLSFGKRLKWIGVSHPWGEQFKPSDIIVPFEE